MNMPFFFAMYKQPNINFESYKKTKKKKKLSMPPKTI